MDLRKELGRTGEDIALNYLENKGWKLLHKNWRNKYGELDLIMHNQDKIIFIEVRTKKSLQYGTGTESVNKTKQQKIRKLAMMFLQDKKYYNHAIRFDVVSIYFANDKINIQHVEEAF